MLLQKSPSRSRKSNPQSTIQRSDGPFYNSRKTQGQKRTTAFTSPSPSFSFRATSESPPLPMRAALAPPLPAQIDGHGKHCRRLLHFLAAHRPPGCRSRRGFFAAAVVVRADRFACRRPLLFSLYLRRRQAPLLAAPLLHDPPCSPVLFPRGRRCGRRGPDERREEQNAGGGSAGRSKAAGARRLGGRPLRRHARRR